MLCTLTKRDNGIVNASPRTTYAKSLFRIPPKSLFTMKWLLRPGNKPPFIALKKVGPVKPCHANSVISTYLKARYGKV